MKHIDMKHIDMKHIAVIIRSDSRARVAEALRAALGLSLRGARVTVVVCECAVPVLEAGDTGDIGIRRAHRTLQQLGHEVVIGTHTLARHARAADAVEVWT